MTPRILVIDDNKDSLELSRRILELDQYEVLTAQTGNEALAVLKANSIQLILLDYLLQDMEGSELLKTLDNEIPQITSRVPVVFFTAYNCPPTGTKAAGFISKSVDLDDFLAQVKRFLSRPPGTPLQ